MSTDKCQGIFLSISSNVENMVEVNTCMGSFLTYNVKVNEIEIKNKLQKKIAWKVFDVNEANLIVILELKLENFFFVK